LLESRDSRARKGEHLRGLAQGEEVIAPNVGNVHSWKSSLGGTLVESARHGSQEISRSTKSVHIDDRLETVNIEVRQCKVLAYVDAHLDLRGQPSRTRQAGVYGNLKKIPSPPHDGQHYSNELSNVGVDWDPPVDWWPITKRGFSGRHAEYERRDRPCPKRFDGDSNICNRIMARRADDEEINPAVVGSLDQCDDITTDGDGQPALQQSGFVNSAHLAGIKK
jgi:hypothetical protein